MLKCNRFMSGSFHREVSSSDINMSFEFDKVYLDANDHYYSFETLKRTYRNM